MNETMYPVFRRTNLVRESTFECNGTAYRLSIYRMTEMNGDDPVAALFDHFVAEIQTGDFP